MCFVHIVVNGSVFKVPAVALEAKARLAHVFKKAESENKPKAAAKQQSKPVGQVLRNVVSDSRQYGGTAVKGAWYLPSIYRDKDDCGDHYRMRCNASHERRKSRFLTERRRQMVRY